MALDLLKNSVSNSRLSFPTWTNSDPTSSPDAGLLAALGSSASLDTALLAVTDTPYDAKDLSIMSRNDKVYALKRAFENGTWTP